jgi:hypothetical protein
MGNPFLKWLGDIFSDFSKLFFSKEVFCDQPELMLPFVGIGIALVIFSLTQWMPRLEEGEKLKGNLTERKAFSIQEIRRFRGVQNYLALLHFISSAGTFYFLAALFLAILISFQQPGASPSHLYMILNKICYLCIFVPTACISLYYVYYILFKFRIH